jgi:hypothetical protein
MDAPITLKDLLQGVARETARMSYPGSMSRGTKPVVCGGTKALLEEYFVNYFPLREVWLHSDRLASVYDRWHQARIEEIVGTLGTNVSPHNDPSAVAAKFLNTFMHQLMKYEPCRPLWPALHLPLDTRVFSALSKLQYKALCSVQSLFAESPYRLTLPAYRRVQRALQALVKELNDRSAVDVRFSSRIELNWLWL